ncbi:MAG: F0F1 ATP synthase subunit B [Myxococcota bacterium]|nr:F0F1 ATP synthase subunit B [Myxococcota bacterium]
MTRLALLVAGWVLVATRPVFAASGGEGHAVFPLWELVNFAILVGGLVYLGRGPLRELFATRRATIANEIEAASELLAQAEARNAEWQQKIADLDRELDVIRETARRRAEQERERILAEANEAAQRIQRDAVASVEHELRRAQSQLREEAASLATELAAGMLRDQVGDGDRDRLMDEFISSVGTPSRASAGGES